MIIVIVITGIIGGVVAVFMKAPIDGYVDSARRAELTDIADTAVRRMARDVRTAVPNSVRVPSQTGCDAVTPPCYVEYLQAKDGGAYRVDSPNNPLAFDGVDTTFDVLNGPAGILLATNDYVVIGSSQSDGSVVYDRLGLRQVTYAAPLVTLAQGLAAEREMPTRRFDVVDSAQGAVTYMCELVGTDANGTGVGVLRRYSGYWSFAANRTAWTKPAAGTSAVLANNVSACQITYDIANQRFGLLAINLTITRENESVRLYNEIHVNNAP
jgi:MSHA biogenesis protein MshO